MAGTILVTDGVEKLLATTGIMDSYWSPRKQGVPESNTFPDVFCPGCYTQPFLPVASIDFAAFAPSLTVDFKLYSCDNL